MSTTAPSQPPETVEPKTKTLRFPTAFTVLAAVPLLVWVASIFVPAGALLMGGLARSKVGYDRYLKFVWKYLAAAFAVVFVFVDGAAVLS